MESINFCHNLTERFPTRSPGSEELNQTLNELKNYVSGLGLQAEFQEAPVYSFGAAGLIFLTSALIAALLSYFQPLPGLALYGFLWLLMIAEAFFPLLSRIKPTASKNLVISIPARSKETQTVSFITGIATDTSWPTAFKLSSKAYLIGLHLLGFSILLLMILNLHLNLRLLSLFTLLPLIGIAGLTLSVAKNGNGADSGLPQAAVLLDLGKILLRARTNSTTVRFVFTGANSLNSGVYPLLDNLKKGTLNYLISLPSGNKNLTVVTREGLLAPLRSEPFLVNTMKEVANEKDFSLSESSIPENTDSYPFLLRKIKAVTVSRAYTGWAEPALKELRELLTGTVRKLET